MSELDFLIFGYVDIEVSAARTSECATLLLQEGISARVKKDGTIRVSARNAERVKRLFGEEEGVSLSGVRGLYGFLLRRKRNVGFFSAVAVIALLFILSSGVVWDVRIEGVSSEEAESISERLAESGLSVGKRWRNIDKSEVEVNTLKISDDVAWININRRGSVAYVTLAPKQTYDPEPTPVGYANIVAAMDCVIEEILVERGYAVVKAGQTVKKGELLISGVIPTELGGGAVYASGMIRGRYSTAVEARVLEVGTRQVIGEGRLCGYAINFFGFSINIFQNYSNFDKQCAIIEEKSEFFYLADKKLPISVQKSYASLSTAEQFVYTTDGLCKEASRLLRERILAVSDGCDLLRAVTVGELIKGGYRMTAELVLSGEVGVVREFELESR